MNLDLKIYRGYANQQEIVIFGHLFHKKGPEKYHLDKGRLKHAYTMLRLFNLKAAGNATVRLNFKDIDVTTKTEADGYFRFTIPYDFVLDHGWHSFRVSANHMGVDVSEEGELLKPFPGEYGLISDIDDTFLISHSSNLFRKIYLLLTRNINKRKFFEGVVEHYRLLSEAGRKKDKTSNAFFYVSSSEWNLYNFIELFSQMHGFPKAVIKLKKIKTSLADFLFSGSGSHDHKFHKISHLLEFYPELRFVLLGDDTQQDPFIYERVVKMFPQSVVAVYIRQSGNSKKEKVVSTLQNISDMKVLSCYFQRSREAISHSKANGLIP